MEWERGPSAITSPTAIRGGSRVIIREGSAAIHYELGACLKIGLTAGGELAMIHIAHIQQGPAVTELLARRVRGAHIRGNRDDVGQ
jgi:hypothetical protein